MAIEQKVVMPELKKLIEFNFKVEVHIANDGEHYSEFPMLYGNTKITGDYHEDRFDIDYYSDNFSVGSANSHVLCANIQEVLFYLKIRYGFKTNTIFLDIPESN